MKRREEIEKAATEFYKGDEVSTFVVAAQWADKTMIDKACQWLKTNANDFGVPESESGRVYVDDLVAEFREAMED